MDETFDHVNGLPYYDRQGRRISHAEWLDHMADFEFRGVAFDALGRYQVSTVWLGTDNWRGLPVARPLIFETMVFPVLKPSLPGVRGPDYGPPCTTRRYATEAEALAGHDQILAEFRILRAMEDDLAAEP
ncbi:MULTISPECIES: hypothetical protein [unclassified Isoptericola]|uniref:hypothetical protein n=1 Tax=unclassified Isoptericola TaxID=2623355 RepID=UPI002713B8B8|nr:MULTISPECIES: hypothetical protein [unclassified Isoptericola]MDO8144825.1 hypothetical protein [Isoptericola sp. 178]MDO8149605.1 hypothetical protein [Isoptericola sp. b515]MDO8152539.1 hypothetical protein [Isoptericola sp. b408]